jgi:hypothetical protein
LLSKGLAGEGLGMAVIDGSLAAEGVQVSSFRDARQREPADVQCTHPKSRAAE